MDDLKKARSAHSRDGQIVRAREGVPPVRRFSRWNVTWMLILAAAGLLWWLARGISDLPRNPETGIGGAYSPPLPDVPRPKPEEVLNNDTAKLKLPPALEGTAVIYPEVANGLVAPDGRFRTDLPIATMVQMLNLDVRVVARKDSPDNIDPDVVLFTVLVGRLSERAKASSRAIREKEARQGRPSSAAGYEWVKTEHSFTLNSLISPTPEQKEILDAISRSARLVPRRPGEKINAVGLHASSEELLSGKVEFGAGFLPLESPASAAQPTGE
jgi:hypothetical protein